MEIKEMKMADVEARISEINELVKAEDADVDALSAEFEQLEARAKEIKESVEKRNAIAEKVANGLIGDKTEERQMEVKMNENKVYGLDSKEYRNAYLKNLMNKELNTEERALLTGITGNTEGVATDVTNQSPLVPTETLNFIWSKIEKKHPIVADVRRYNSGSVLVIPVHQAGEAAQIVAEGTAPTEEQNTFVKITLAGKDFAKFVDISYAMDRMSIDAFEDYLSDEIAEQMGAAIAADIIATIKATAGVKKVNYKAAGLTYAKAVEALGSLERVGDVVIYGGRGDIFGQFVGMTGDDGHPVFQLDPRENAIGSILGASLKQEDGLANGEFLVMDPERFVLNVIQDVMIETDRDIKKHVHTYSGYARMEGALVDNGSAVLLAVGE